MSFGFGVGDFIAVLDKIKLYRERFADAPDHFDSLSREIKVLEFVLKEIDRLDGQPSDYERRALEPPIQECRKLLDELEEIFEGYTDLENQPEAGKLAKLKPNVIWKRLRLRPEDLQKLRLRISLNVQLLEVIKRSRDSQVIHATKQVVDSIHGRQISSQQREILDWLTTTDYEPQQHDNLSRRQEGTGQWLLESDQFKTCISEKNRTLLCPGIPGAGKTIMASVIVNELIHRFRGDADVGIAYIYFNFKNQGKQSTGDLLSSLAKQLARSRSLFPEFLKTLYETHCNGSTTRTLQDTIDLLYAVSSSFKRLFIIIDALDECTSESRWRFLSEVFRLQERHSANIIATTRNIPEILEFSHFKTAVSLQIRASDADIGQYVDRRMTGMQSFVKKNLEFQKEIKKAVLYKTDGMFLLAKLLMDSLSYKTKPKAIRTALVNVSMGSQVYVEVYDEAWKRIQAQPQEHAELAIEVISWVVCSKRPLEVLELKHALAVEEDEQEIDEENILSTETIISVCAGLVTIDQEGGIIRLVHQTTQEYFETKGHELFPDVHSKIADTCVRYLMLDQTIQLSPDYSDGSNESAFSIRSTESWESGIPLYDYAVLHWGDHARKASVLPSSVMSLLKNQKVLGRCITYMRYWDIYIPHSMTRALLVVWFGIQQVFTAGFLPIDEFYESNEPAIWYNMLWLAVDRGHLDLVKYLLMSGTLEYVSDLPKVNGLEEDTHCRRRPLQFRDAFLKAVDRRSTAMVEVFINSCLRLGADPELESDRLRSLLITAIKDKDPPTIKKLLDEVIWFGIKPVIVYHSLVSITGIQLKKTDCAGRIALVSAVSAGMEVVVQNLLDLGANIDATTTQGLTPLSSVIQELSDLPLSRRFNPRNEMSRLLEIISQHDAHTEPGNGPTSLSPAATRWIVSAMKTLLKYGAQVGAQDDKGRTPLILAAEAGQESAVELLISHNADIEAQDLKGETALMKAAKEGHEPTLKILLDRGAKIEVPNENGETAILKAAKSGHESAIEILLDFKADIEPRDRSGRSALSWAAANGLIRVLERLISNGAEIEVRDNEGMTPLLNCVYSLSGAEEIFKILHRNGANIQVIDYQGRSILHHAAEYASTGLIKWILETTDLDPNLTDRDGHTPLWHSMQRHCHHSERQDTIKILLGDSRVTNPMPSCQALLRVAVELDSQDFLSYLLAREDADVNGMDEYGMTPFRYALKSSNLSMLRVLRELGAKTDNMADVEVLTPRLRRWRGRRGWVYFKV